MTTPKLPPPPLRAQNRSEFCVSFTVRNSPFESMTSKDITLSQVSPSNSILDYVPAPRSGSDLTNITSKVSSNEVRG